MNLDLAPLRQFQNRLRSIGIGDNNDDRQQAAQQESEKARGNGDISWLATITRNKVRDYFRSAARSIDAEGGSSAVGRLAELTGLSLASVYQAKSRVLRRLRQRVEDCS